MPTRSVCLVTLCPYPKLDLDASAASNPSQTSTIPYHTIPYQAGIDENFRPCPSENRARVLGADVTGVFGRLGYIWMTSRTGL